MNQEDLTTTLIILSSVMLAGHLDISLDEAIRTVIKLKPKISAEITKHNVEVGSDK